MKEGGGRGEGTILTPQPQRQETSEILKKTRTGVVCYKPLSSPQAPAVYPNKNSNNIQGVPKVRSSNFLRYNF